MEIFEWNPFAAVAAGHQHKVRPKLKREVQGHAGDAAGLVLSINLEEEVSKKESSTWNRDVLSQSPRSFLNLSESNDLVSHASKGTACRHLLKI